MSIYIYIIFIHTYIYMYIYVIYLYIYIYIYIYVFIHVYVYVYTYIYVSTFIYIVHLSNLINIYTLTLYARSLRNQHCTVLLLNYFLTHMCATLWSCTCVLHCAHLMLQNTFCSHLTRQFQYIQRSNSTYIYVTFTHTNIHIYIY